MIKIWILISTIVVLTSCTLPVLKQDIPVSSNPVGASIYANGEFVGYTPTTVHLDRNRDHIVTLISEDYRQEDIPVVRQYLQNRVMMRAIQSGLNTGLNFKDTRMGINSGMQSISMQEQTGEAYMLVPNAIVVDLVPLYGMKREQQPYRPQGQTSQPGDLRPIDAAAVGAAAGLSQMKPAEKKWETSSSRSYVKPDGTKVTESSRSSVSVGVNPSGIVDALDKLFR